MGARQRLARVVAVVVVAAAMMTGFVLRAGALPDPGAGDADLSGVLTLNGNAVVDAQVCVVDDEGGVCDLTVAGGLYSFDDLVAGSYELWVLPPDGSYGLAIGGSLGTYVPVPAIPVTIGSGGNTTNVPLTDGGRIHVTAHHPGGALADSLPVTMCRTDAPGPGSCPQIVDATTDGVGEATSVSLLPGTYRVVVGFANTPGESPKTLPAVVVSPGSTTDLDVTLEVPGALEGFVRNTDGYAIPGATVSISANGSTFGTGTDATGHYSLTNVVPDTYSVSGSILGFPYGSTLAPGVVVAPGTTTTQDLVLPSIGFAGITGTSTRTVPGSYFFNGVVACPGGGHNIVGAVCSSAVFTTTNGFGAFALSLTPGVTYNVAPGYTSLVGQLQLVGQEIPVTVAAGETLHCAFVTGATSTSTCSSAPPDDGDGVAEPPSGFPANYDGNGDGWPDALQANVTSLLPAVGTQPVTIASPTGTTLGAVTASAVPASPTPPAGATFPVGVLAFEVHLPVGQNSADVAVSLPAGSNPNSYYKLQGGAWVDFTSHVTIAGDEVTLHLVDNDAFDANPASGVIGDPGGPAISTSTGYDFNGFGPPIDNGIVNSAKAGQAIPVKWRITDANGAGISDPASFVGLTSAGGPCVGGPTDEIEAYAPNAAGLRYLGNGNWQFDWKTIKEWKGHCRTLTLELADGSTHTASFGFK